MTNHPTPKVIATHLRTVANLLDDHGTLAIDLAAVLASRGLPSAVGGSGSRSADTTTSVERAAGTDQDTDRNTRWDDIDVRLARLLRLTWKVGLDVQTTIGDIVAHAQDLDEVPAGTGSCLCCSNICRPDHRHPERRLRSGFCPSCYKAWIRWRQHHHPDRSAFVFDRRAELLRRAQQRESRRLGA